MDRREAIKKALQLAKPGDIFVITGKGAEEVMVIGAQRIPWNEKKVILEELKKQNH
jgi:UDP-N-acetylmuramoyl-L-alanyl-D-glutamate--2,6-diaminopimelate ligase